MKKVLIISPNFPPVNAADMHRIRQSLPYFKELGWEPVVLAVDEKFVGAYSTDPLLLYTVPADIEVHKVGAWETSRTRKFGLSSLGIRAYTHLRRKGDELLKERHFDLVYFSTVAFHVMALGPRWKRKFGVPFILDIQDPNPSVHPSFSLPITSINTLKGEQSHWRMGLFPSPGAIAIRSCNVIHP
jgi:hypothetical protein